MSNQEKKNILEAILFIENAPVDSKKLAKSTGLEIKELHIVAKELQEEYEVRSAGIAIVEVENGYQMIAHPRFALALSKLYAPKTQNKLSRTVMETLAIIAYRQPMTKSEVEKIRGVASDRVIKNLLEKDLIKIVGRREQPGKPLEYATTVKFLKAFSLKTVADLPRLREIKEMEFNIKDEE